MFKRLTKKEYDFIYDRVPRLCVDIVIKDKKGLLLTLRNIEPQKNRWHFPGGRVFYGETIAKAVKRILKAETNLNVRLDKLIGFMEFPNEKQFNKRRHSVSLVFSAKIISGYPRIDTQASKICFFKSIPPRMHKTHGKFLTLNGILKK
jgi:ADP-ribose pyrophosphatase YjhB (NUDIX family)